MRERDEGVWGSGSGFVSIPEHVGPDSHGPNKQWDSGQG